MAVQDTMKRERMEHRMGRMGMPVMPPMWGMHRSFGHGMWPGMDMWMPWYGMHRGMYGYFGRGQGYGLMIDRIPNLTDKQKKEIADLRQKHQDEMQKLRSDFQSKMQDVRDSHRKEIMNVLTDEQKKWLEENNQITPQPTAPPEPPSAPEAPKAPVM